MLLKFKCSCKFGMLQYYGVIGVIGVVGVIGVISVISVSV